MRKEEKKIFSDHVILAIFLFLTAVFFIVMILVDRLDFL